MVRGCLLLVPAALLCAAESPDHGFVNRAQLRPEVLFQTAEKPAPPDDVSRPSQKRCARIPLIERLPAAVSSDPKMILPKVKTAVDPKMAIEPPPACPER